MVDGTCSIEGCVKPSRTRGWCVAHYTRWIRWGSPTGSSPRNSYEQKFWEKVDKTGPCWEWLGAVNAYGYGRFYINGTEVMAHRYSYELLRDPIPKGMPIDHKCHNTRCVNPDHLRPVTHKQNLENRHGPQKNNTSGILGVHLNKRTKKWHAEVKHNGRKYHAGNFDSLVEAEAAVIAKRNELFTHNDLDRTA